MKFFQWLRKSRERKDQLNIHEGRACRCQKCLSEIDISTSATEGSVGFVSISEEEE